MHMKAIPERKHARKDNVLYYPFIRIPNGDWLRTSLLYWDEVSSIVPNQWEAENKYPTYISDLLSEGFFRPIRPNLAFQQNNWYELFNSFEQEFKGIVDSDSFRKRIIRTYKAGIPLKWVLYRDKVTDSVRSFLIERSLAINVEGKYQLLVEKFTGLIYMSLFAKYLSSVDSSHTIPATNEKVYFNLIFSKSTETPQNACYDLRLNDILPVPKSSVSLTKILKFKYDRRQELMAFKKVIDELKMKLSNAKQFNEVEDLIHSTRNQIILGVKNLTSTLKEARVETGVGALKTLINVKNAAIITTTEAALHYVEASPILKVAIPILTGAVELSHYFTQRSNQINAAVRNSSFAYIYHAKKAGIT